jgi:hypothetical protein
MVNSEEVMASAFKSRPIRTLEDKEEYERKMQDEAEDAGKTMKTEGDKFLDYFTNVVKKKNKVKE